MKPQDSDRRLLSTDDQPEQPITGISLPNCTTNASCVDTRLSYKACVHSFLSTWKVAHARRISLWLKHHTTSLTNATGV